MPPLNTHRPRGRPGRSKTQADVVLELLKQGSTVTRMTAAHYRIANLPDVIMRLRRRGVQIIANTVTDQDGVEFTSYRLFEPKVVTRRPAAPERDTALGRIALRIAYA